MRITLKENKIINAVIERLYFEYGDAINDLKDDIKKGSDLFDDEKYKADKKAELAEVRDNLRTITRLDKKLAKQRYSA
jgi:translation initiation factor 2 alpha subunit (eIF-2alpha)